MSAIRKLPVRINEKKRSTFRGEFLIPKLCGTAESGFLSINTGLSCELGAVVFLGTEVTPDLLLERFCERNPPPSDGLLALRILNEYVEALNAVRIGNVLSVSYGPDGSLILKVEAKYFLNKPIDKLPG